MEIRSLTDGGKLARRTLARHQDTGYCIQNQVAGRMERQRLAHPAGARLSTTGAAPPNMEVTISDDADR